MQWVRRVAGIVVLTRGAVERGPEQAVEVRQVVEAGAEGDGLPEPRPQGAGALYSTVDDLNLWDQALYTDKLVKQPLLQQSFVRHKALDGTPQPYGYGWMMADLAGQATQEHSGGIEGFSSYAIRIPSQQVYVAVLANSSNFDSYTLAVKLAAIAIGKPLEPDPITLPAATLTAITGNYRFDDVVNGNDAN